MNETSSTAESGKDPHKANRTQWHRILGTLLELLLTRFGITVQSEVQVMSDPPKVDILLLRREGDHWTDEQHHLLCDGLRDTNASHLLVEFKYSESLTADALLQALSYHYFYRQAQNLEEAELQVFVMVARTPRRSMLQRFGFEVSERSGVYHSQQPLLEKIQVIVLNQLQAETHNAFVQCFASQRRVYQGAFERIQEIGIDQLSRGLWALVAGLQSQRDRKGGAMTKKVQEEALTAEKLIEIGEQTRKFVLATLSRDDQRMIASHMRPEDILASLAPKDRLAGLAPEDRLAGLAPEDRLAGLAPEDMPKLMKQIEAFLRKQQSLDG